MSVKLQRILTLTCTCTTLLERFYLKKFFCSLAHFGPAPNSVPILLDEVSCSPGMVSLSQCVSNEFGVHDCTHGEDASVSCSSGKRERKEEVGTSFYVHILIVLLSLTLIILSLSLFLYSIIFSFIYLFIHCC